jgi:glutamine synthetase
MTDLAAWAHEQGVRYFMVSFTDLFGAQRAKLVPTRAIAEMQAEGAGFAGFATWLDMTPAHPDMLAVPDPQSAVRLPWRPEVAWVAANPEMGGEAVAQAPRNVLRRQLDAAAARGLRIMTGVEPEFHLLMPDGSAIADPADTADKPCYDQSALMRRFDVIAEICDAMLDLGWGPYQNDHEDSNGQFEMNWTYAEAGVTADRHSFFKFLVKSVAERHGLRATFMPKPLPGLTGNGCHVHVSAVEGEARVFDGNHPTGLSDVGRHFLGGIMRHGAALSAIANPTVNSYKRMFAGTSTSGATWAPSTITWAGNNRTHMVRVPAPGRFELRLPDGAANPYLLQAAIVAAGLDGIETRADPGEPLDIDMQAEGDRIEAPRLPRNLLDALRALEADEVLRAALGEPFASAYLKLQHAEWDRYMAHFTEWERDRTLDV